ncbi:MAG: aspartate carbamoyltransferase catalytic subunit [SAR202 cluster bacterium]|nr:aspartate carbamoyltransferase catalytic subunit [SAR202 cluster bacterium]
MSLSRTIETPNIDDALAVARPPRKHVLDLDDFSREEISEVLESARSMKEVLGRDIKKVPALRGRVIVTLFYEASTRTRISFEEAGKVLSADVINMSASGSSAEKGESLLNTGLTIQAMGVDTIVIRHPHSGAPYLLAQHLNKVSIINAGDGLHAHPTQALLDLYTVQDKLGVGGQGSDSQGADSRGSDSRGSDSMEGLKVVIVGDVLHSRVARSNIWGFAKMGAKVVLSGPNTLMPPDLLRSKGNIARSQIASMVEVDTNLDRAIEGADVVMALRLQQERQNAGFLPSLREYIRRWQVTDDRLAKAKPKAMVMHPGPMNEGIEISNSIAHGGSSVIEEQVTNGVAVRMALLYKLTIGAPE